MDTLALPLALIVEKNHVIASARRADNNAIRPTQNGHVGQSVVGVGKEYDCILQSLWLLAIAFHAVNIRGIA
jgi:hypothetical protein